MKICMDICPRTLSVPRSEQFSESVPCGKLSIEEQISNVQGQTSVHIFKPNGDYCLYYPSNIFHNTHSFENWGISSDIPQFEPGIFGHVMRLDQSYMSLNI